MVETPGGAFDCVFFGVFDGHGEAGADVAEFLRDAVPKAFFASPLLQDWVAVSDNIPRAGTPGASAADTLSLRASARAPVGPTRTRRNVAGALRAALLDAERALLARGDIDCALAGSTACIAVVSDIDHLTVANVGDSRAVLLRRNASGALVADGVTVDHKPTLPGETRRILLKGGRVHALSYDDGPDGPVRVWLGREDSPGLAMSRSVGDTVGKRAGVSSEPDVYSATLEPGADALLVLATDGLWEFCSGEDVAECTARAEGAAARAAAEAAAAGPDAPPPPQLLQLALDALVDEATARWQANDDAIDDISVLMAEIGVQAAALM
jgi:serine/threonine protein phosphatase PrpC